MRISIGCVDGNTYYSDHVSDHLLLEHLAAANGRIGTGVNSDLVVEDLEAFRELMLGFCKYDSSNKNQVVSMVISGADRQFNVRHIVWAEVALDSDK